MVSHRKWWDFHHWLQKQKFLNDSIYSTVHKNRTLWGSFGEGDFVTSFKLNKSLFKFPSLTVLPWMGRLIINPYQVSLWIDSGLLFKRWSECFYERYCIINIDKVTNYESLIINFSDVMIEFQRKNDYLESFAQLKYW